MSAMKCFSGRCSTCGRPYITEKMTQDKMVYVRCQSFMCQSEVKLTRP